MHIAIKIRNHRVISFKINASAEQISWNNNEEDIYIYIYIYIYKILKQTRTGEVWINQKIINEQYPLK